MASRTAYSTWTPQKPTLFDGHYLRNRSTLDIGFLGYIGIVQHKEHSPEVLSIPAGTSCICDGTRAETRFCLSAKRKSPFKSARASVQSTTGSRGERISGNAGYTMFGDSVKSTGYPLQSPVSP